MIISINAEKAFDRIQHPFMTKTLTKVGIKGTYLSINKSHLWQTHSQYNTQWRKVENLAEIGNKARIPTLITFFLFNIVLEVLAIAIRQAKGKKNVSKWKRRGKTVITCR